MKAEKIAGQIEEIIFNAKQALDNVKSGNYRSALTNLDTIGVDADYTAAILQEIYEQEGREKARS